MSKIEVEIRDPVAACLDYMKRNAVDLIVLATADRRRRTRLRRASRAERLARRSGVFTLFVPEGGRYFVDADSGAVTLERILVPVDPGTDPSPAMVRAVSAADELSADAIYMSTSWSRSRFGRPDGKVPEGVVSAAVCPVAAVPARDA